MKSLIKISPGFQYAINMKYDIHDLQKVQGYIPTEKAINITSDVIDSLDESSVDRARIIVGSYGTGKSHFLTFLSAMLQKSFDEEAYDLVLDKMGSNGKNLIKEKIQRKFFNVNGKFLIVMINGNGSSIEQSFRIGLREALQRENLEDLMPNSIYRHALHTMSIWKEEFPETYSRFLGKIVDDGYWELDEFLHELDNYGEQAIEYFLKVYPILTSGSQLTAFDTSDIKDLYESVAQQLVNNTDGKYRGLFIVFDEFNKCLENMASSKQQVNLKLLQDLAEASNRSGKVQIHLTLITHQHISQYVSKMPEHVVNEWLKIEGRFKSIDFHQHSSRIFGLISKVIQKDHDEWIKYKTSHKMEFEQLIEMTKGRALYHDLNEQQLREWIIEGCFPLHPATTYVLPHVSNLVAQNERTLFTFLSLNDFNTLGEFVERKNDGYDLLTLDLVFDYFSDLMKKHNYNERPHTIWRQVQKIIQKVDTKTAEDENIDVKQLTKLVKTIAMILIMDDDKLLPPNVTFLEFAMWRSMEGNIGIKKYLLFLQKQKAIQIKKSTGVIRFFEGSDIDIDNAVENVIHSPKYASQMDPSNIANDYFLPYPIIANRFNDRFEMTRYFLPRYYFMSNFASNSKQILWTEELKNFEDGILAMLVPENKGEQEEIIKIVAACDNSQILFSLPNAPMSVSKSLKKFQALMILSKDKQFLEGDSRIEMELQFYIDDLREEIEMLIGNIVEPKSNLTVFYYCGKEQKEIKTRADLSKKVSEICEKVFYRTPLINNEMVNKNNPSKTIENARKKVIQNLLNNIEEEQIGLTGYGPDVSIYKSVLNRTSLHEKLKNHLLYQTEWKQFTILATDVKYNDDKDAYNRQCLEKILSEIEDCMFNKETCGSFEMCIDELKRPPYGIRAGIIPVLVAVEMMRHKHYLLIKDSEGIEQPLSADVIENMTKRPAYYSVEIENINLEKEKYLSELNYIFGDFISQQDKITSNKLYPVAQAMKSWYISLPKYSRDTSRLYDDSKGLLKALKERSNDSQKLLFRQIPYYLLGHEYFKENKWANYLQTISNAKSVVDEHLYSVNASIKKNLIETFCGKGSESLLSTTRNWYERLHKNTQEHLFSGAEGNLIRTITDFKGYDDEKFLQDLYKNITGLRIEDWKDSTYDEFVETINVSIKTIENRNSTSENRDEPLDDLIRISIPKEDGTTLTRTFNMVKISDYGDILKNNIKQSLDSFADSLPSDEKRQILVQLLEDLT